MTSEAVPPTVLRSDARRNRERLVAAARAAFAEDGVAASLEGIAARAGVGIGTLYRHFPSRELLVEAVFDGQVARWLEAAERAAACDDAWEGLSGYLERMLELQAEHRALHDVFTEHPPGDARHGDAREELRMRLELIVSRAREQGSLRADCTVADLVLLFWSLGPVVDATSGAPHAARRHLGFALDGLRAGAATAPAAAPLTDDELSEAARVHRERRFPRRAARAAR